jgi:hypothetical protein
MLHPSKLMMCEFLRGAAGFAAGTAPGFGFDLSNTVLTWLRFERLRGEDSEAMEIQSKLEELEEKANGLDKMRTSTISSISYINDRNRKKNVAEAEKAIMVSKEHHDVCR